MVSTGGVFVVSGIFTVKILTVVNVVNVYKGSETFD